MDLETEALLFSKTFSRKRRDFNATLFSEISLKQHREIQIYGLLAHKLWIELESDRDVVDYNELPKTVQIPLANRVLSHSFKFAVRKANGIHQVIDIDNRSAKLIEASNCDSKNERLEKRNAIQNWCCRQEIEYRCITSDSFAGHEVRLSNLRAMLKYIESVHDTRDVVSEERVNITVALLSPLPIRRVLEELSDCDETVVLAQLARGIFSGNFFAPIEVPPDLVPRAF